MITASHNPAQDNGYKVYGSNGCQINSPVDQQIAASILLNLGPISWKVQDPRHAHARKSVLDEVQARYFEKIKQFVRTSKDKSPPRFVYTPMHGVGLKYMVSMLSRGPNRMVPVKEQAQPDPDFPTVKYPNPEETGALVRLLPYPWCIVQAAKIC